MIGGLAAGLRIYNGWRGSGQRETPLEREAARRDLRGAHPE
jgi:hypothetical protein